jgi:hypothetical protein
MTACRSERRTSILRLDVFKQGGEVFSSRHAAAAAVLVLLFAACGGGSGDGRLSTEERTVLEQTAGVLARYWCLPEDDPGWLPAPSDSLIGVVQRICLSKDGAWTYFYVCMSDTADVLPPPPFEESADPGEDPVDVAEDDDRE